MARIIVSTQSDYTTNIQMIRNLTWEGMDEKVMPTSLIDSIAILGSVEDKLLEQIPDAINENHPRRKDILRYLFYASAIELLYVYPQLVSKSILGNREQYANIMQEKLEFLHNKLRQIAKDLGVRLEGYDSADQLEFIMLLTGPGGDTYSSHSRRTPSGSASQGSTPDPSKGIPSPTLDPSTPISPVPTDPHLQEQIDEIKKQLGEEIDNRIDADHEEGIERSQSDQSLQSQIDTINTDRSGLEAEIENESVERSKADNNLQDQIDTRVNNEQSERESADDNIRISVNKLDTDLETEQTERVNSDRYLETKIDDLNTDLSDKFNTDLDTERTERVNADNELQDKIDELLVKRAITKRTARGMTPFSKERMEDRRYGPMLAFDINGLGEMRPYTNTPMTGKPSGTPMLGRYPKHRESAEDILDIFEGQPEAVKEYIWSLIRSEVRDLIRR